MGVMTVDDIKFAAEARTPLGICKRTRNGISLQNNSGETFAVVSKNDKKHTLIDYQNNIKQPDRKSKEFGTTLDIAISML